VNKLIPLIVFIILVIFLFLSLNSSPNRLPSPLIGKMFPVLEGADFYTNQKVNLNDLMANQLTLVNVWASWCITCRKEHQMIMDISQNNNLKLIGINYKDTKVDAEEYLKVKGKPFDEVIFDPKGKIGMDLGVYATPETFIINKEGLIIYKHIGEITKEVWSENFEYHLNMTES